MNNCNIQSLIFYQNVTPYLHLALRWSVVTVIRGGKQGFEVGLVGVQGLKGFKILVTGAGKVGVRVRG